MVRHYLTSRSCPLYRRPSSDAVFMTMSGGSTDHRRAPHPTYHSRGFTQLCIYERDRTQDCLIRLHAGKVPNLFPSVMQEYLPDLVFDFVRMGSNMHAPSLFVQYADRMGNNIAFGLLEIHVD